MKSWILEIKIRWLKWRIDELKRDIEKQRQLILVLSRKYHFLNDANVLYEEMHRKQSECNYLLAKLHRLISS